MIDGFIPFAPRHPPARLGNCGIKSVTRTRNATSAHNFWAFSDGERAAKGSVSACSTTVRTSAQTQANRLSNPAVQMLNT